MLGTDFLLPARDLQRMIDQHKEMLDSAASFAVNSDVVRMMASATLARQEIMGVAEAAMRDHKAIMQTVADTQRMLGLMEVPTFEVRNLAAEALGVIGVYRNQVDTLSRLLGTVGKLPIGEFQSLFDQLPVDPIDADETATIDVSDLDELLDDPQWPSLAPRERIERLLQFAKRYGPGAWQVVVALMMICQFYWLARDEVAEDESTAIIQVVTVETSLRIVNYNSVRVRDGATRDSSTVATVEAGEYVVMVRRHRKWTLIRWASDDGPQQGWVLNKRLDRVGN